MVDPGRRQGIDVSSTPAARDEARGAERAVVVEGEGSLCPID